MTLKTTRGDAHETHIPEQPVGSATRSPHLGNPILNPYRLGRAALDKGRALNNAAPIVPLRGYLCWILYPVTLAQARDLVEVKK